MSLLDDNSIQVITSYSNVVDVGHKKTYIINKAGISTAYTPVTTTSFSSANINWNYNVNNGSTIISPYIILGVPMQAVLTGTGAGGSNLLIPGNGTFALRAFGLNQCIQSASFNLNSSTFTAQPYLYTSAVVHQNIYQKELSLELSATPTLLDNSQQYSDTFGASTNPLSNFQSSQYYQNGRGAYPYIITANTNTSATIQWVSYEPLFLSPFCISPHEDRGFIGVTKFELQLQLGQLNRMLSYNVANGNGITSAAVTVVANSLLTAPTMYMRSVSPDTILYKIPNEVKYPFENVQVLTTATGGTGITSGTNFTITSQNNILTQIPSKIMIYARVSDATLQSATGYTYSDAFATMSGINVQFNNKNGLLSSARPIDLWRLSVRNGLNVPWVQWSGANPYVTGAPTTQATLGSILVLDVAKDFGLDQDMAAGVYGSQFSFQATVNLTNPSTTTQDYTLFVVYFYDGVYTLTPGSSFMQLGVLSREDVLNAPILNQQIYNEKTSWNQSAASPGDQTGNGLMSGTDGGALIVGGRKATRKQMKR